MSLVNPRSITEAERPWLEGAFTAEDQADLIDRVKALGYADSIALGLAGWLARKYAGRKDEASQDTRARYRAILREVFDAADRVGAIPGYRKVALQILEEGD